MKKVFGLIITLVTILCLSSCRFTILSLADIESMLFSSYLGDDYYAWNIMLSDSSSFGLERGSEEATYYSYQKLDTSSYSSARDSFVTINQLLELNDYNSLSDVEKITYDNISLFLDYYIDFYDSSNSCDRLRDMSYIDSTGGYVSNFSSLVTSYHLRNETDVKDLISYTKSTKDSFSTYYDYALDRIESGYPLSDYTLDNMISYLTEIISKGNNYYLYDILETKIKECDFLTDNKNEYIAQSKYAMDDFITGCKELKDKLQSCKGHITSINDEGYYNKYNCKTQYEIELEHLLGFKDLNMDNYISYLDNRLNAYKIVLGTIANEYKDNEEFLAYLKQEKSLTDLSDTNSMISYLKEFSKTIVPNLESEPNINISYMDETTSSLTTTVAYYTKSPIDILNEEYITLNPMYLTDSLELLSTLSHEGYPGHLYDYNYQKQLDISSFAKVNTNVGRAEGYAVYVQYKLYEYLGDQINTPEAKAYSLYEGYNNLYSYLLQTRIDCGINYQGWSLDTLNNYFILNGLNLEIVERLYRTLIEMPTAYAAYGFGSAFMFDLHAKAKDILADKYNEVSFNKALLDTGLSGLEATLNYVNTYISSLGANENIVIIS